MAKKSMGNMIGSWAFLLGVVLAVVFGFLGTLSPMLVISLVVIGLIVGFLNVAGTETTPFLLSGAVLIIASGMGQTVFGGIMYLENILTTLMYIFVPATIIVAIKNVFMLAKN